MKPLLCSRCSSIRSNFSNTLAENYDSCSSSKFSSKSEWITGPFSAAPYLKARLFLKSKDHRAVEMAISWKGQFFRVVFFSQSFFFLLPQVHWTHNGTLYQRSGVDPRFAGEEMQFTSTVGLLFLLCFTTDLGTNEQAFTVKSVQLNCSARFEVGWFLLTRSP